MKNVLYHKEIIPKEKVFIDIEDRGYQFGDGVYEVIGVYKGKTFKMNEHLERLQNSAKELKITLPYDIKIIKSKLEKLCSVNKLSFGMVYVQITRGIASRNHPFPEETTNPVLVGYTKEMEKPEIIQKNGVNCILTIDSRWLKCHIKTLNLLGNVLAKQEAIEHNCYEAILHRDGIVTEGSSANLFIIKDDVLYTHPANNYILNGITRSTVIDLCEKLNLKIFEKSFTKEQLFYADEVFLTGTIIDVVPVVQIDNVVIGTGSPGSITKRIQNKYEALYD